MADNFDLRKYLAENKLTKNTPAYKGPKGMMMDVTVTQKQIL